MERRPMDTAAKGMSGIKLHSPRAFGHHWTLWKCLGLQPPQCGYKWYWHYICYAVLLNITVTLFFPCTLVVHCMRSKNIAELCENLYVTTTDVLCNMKTINVFMVREKLLKAHRILQRLDLRAGTQKEREEIQLGISKARNWFILIMRMYSCPIWTSQLVVYLAEEPSLMYPAWFPWDWRTSKLRFWLTHTYQLFGLIVQTLQNLGNDTYPQAYISVLIAHIRALGWRLKALGQSDESGGVAQTDEELYRQLIACIKDHMTLQELFLIIEQAISWTCFAQFLATGLAQCTMGVYVIVVGFEVSRLLNSMLFFGAVTYEIFVLCYFCDLYCQANDFLIDAIYDCNWIDRDERFKKAILLLLQRAQHSKCFMAGNFIPVRLPTFAQVMKTAYSAFTFLNKFN